MNFRSTYCKSIHGFCHRSRTQSNFETSPDSQATSAELLMTVYSVYLIIVVQNSMSTHCASLGGQQDNYEKIIF